MNDEPILTPESPAHQADAKSKTVKFMKRDKSTSNQPSRGKKKETEREARFSKFSIKDLVGCLYVHSPTKLMEFCEAFSNLLYLITDPDCGINSEDINNMISYGCPMLSTLMEKERESLQESNDVHLELTKRLKSLGLDV